MLEDSINVRLVENVPTIIFGADVSHPPPGEDSSSSIAAVCLIIVYCSLSFISLCTC